MRSINTTYYSPQTRHSLGRVEVLLITALMLAATTLCSAAIAGEMVKQNRLLKIEVATPPKTEGTPYHSNTAYRLEEGVQSMEKSITTLLFHFSQPPPVPRLFSIHSAQQLIVDFLNTTEDPRLSPPRPPPPLEGIEVASNGERVRTVISMQEPLLYHIMNSGHTLQLSLFRQNSAQHQPLPIDNNGLINLSLEREPVAGALRKIAGDAGQNLILNGNIAGTTTLQLRQVYWRDAFNLLIEQNRLQLLEQDNILIISDVQQQPKPVDPASPMNETPSSVQEIHTEIIPLHYSDAADLKKTLESDQKNPLLSERGVLGVDERTNSLLIQESRERLEQIRTLIKQLDTPSRQVLIESRIVIAADDFSHELGARLGITHSESAQEQWGFSLSGSSEAADTALSGNRPGIDGDSSRLSVNLPATNPAGRIGLTLAKLATGSLLDLELSAAQIEGRTEIIASPQIITSDGYEAIIQQGVQIPYRSDTLSGGTDISFKDAVMELRVTPQITPDHRIILTLRVKKDAVGAILCSGCEPSVDTREVKTRVMMDDGETLVIGGIYEERKSSSENRVPLLADIPFIGNLFKNQSEADGKGELLIFITPSILPEEKRAGEN